MADSKNDRRKLYSDKRCPYCFTHLKLEAEFCLECRAKVGKVDKYGLAKKPINYKAYLASALWIVLLAIYIWKVFIVRLVLNEE